MAYDWLRPFLNKKRVKQHPDTLMIGRQYFALQKISKTEGEKRLGIVKGKSLVRKKKKLKVNPNRNKKYRLLM